MILRTFIYHFKLLFLFVQKFKFQLAPANVTEMKSPITNCTRHRNFDVFSAGLPPQAATEKSLFYMKKRVTGCGGAIAVDTSGRVGIHCSTQRMSWARIGGKTQNETLKSKHVVEYGCDMTNISRENF